MSRVVRFMFAGGVMALVAPFLAVGVICCIVWEMYKFIRGVDEG